VEGYMFMVKIGASSLNFPHAYLNIVLEASYALPVHHPSPTRQKITEFVKLLQFIHYTASNMKSLAP